MELRDLLEILEQDERITIKTDDAVKAFRIERAYVEDVVLDFPEWVNAFVSGLAMTSDGEYVITIIPDDEEE